MKALLIAAYLSSSVALLSGKGSDKFAHWGISYLATDISYELVKPKDEGFSWGGFLTASSSIFILGLVKELVIDPRPSGSDVLANALGTFGSITVKIEF